MLQGEKRPVKLVYYDDRSDKETVVKLYEKLINEDKVDVCFAPFGSTLTGAAAAITAKHGKMLIIWSAASDAIYAQGYKFIVSATETPVSLMPKPEIDHMTKLGVKINLGKEVNKVLVEKVKPDVLILATGGLYSIPEIPGIDSRKVLRAADLNRRLKSHLRFIGPRLLIWATKFWMPIGKSVVIIGGGIHGLQTAVFLVKRGRKVTVVETAEKMGEMVIEIHKVRLFGWLEQKGVQLLSGVKYEEITDKGLIITTKEGEKKILAADTIFPSLSMVPDTELVKSLKETAPEIYQIGDCGNPALIIDAIGDGSRIGRAI